MQTVMHDIGRDVFELNEAALIGAFLSRLEGTTIEERLCERTWGPKIEPAPEPETEGTWEESMEELARFMEEEATHS